jgi:drug/metabolite transporter (DMT)-like permease
VTDRLALMAMMGAATAAIAVPLALVVSAPRAVAWPEVAGSLVLHTIYNLMLVASYRVGDYNQVYPLARGTAPPVVAIASVIVVGEQLTEWQVVGLVILSGGLLTLAVVRRPGSPRAVGLAVLTGLLIAAYTVTDGVGVRHSGSVLGYAAWLFTGSGLLTALTVRLWLGRADGTAATDSVISPSGLEAPRTAPGVAARGVLAAALSVLAYVLVLWAQTRGSLAVVAALRETSVVFAACLGALVFREHLASRRIIASALVAAGAAVLALR